MFSTMTTAPSTRMPKSMAPIEQARRNVLQIQADEGEKKRQRDRDRDDQSRAHVVEEENEDDQHQQHAVQQVVRNRVRGERDQVAPVVERPHLHPAGESTG